ncbi:Hypothetical predicted protein [Mytilus galloprovincialis]|uniref:HECT domain-containing protein n=1 Tax=Mytilus galloprovincialis TaxID=29158 RepID=A0A8B6HSR7_MYTGA|nr:Hypothetical predicted protein [Mytilus galloprovincialis]
MATNQPQNLTEWQLQDVLQRVNLLQYYDNFIREGKCDLLKLSNAEESRFKDVMQKVGMAEKPLHVRRFKTSLSQWVDDPGKNDHVPSYIKKDCNVKLTNNVGKTQNANRPIPKRRSTIMGRTNNESENNPAGTSGVSTASSGRIASTIRFLETQNIPAGTSTVLTSRLERNDSTIGDLEHPRRIQPISARINDQVAIGYRTCEAQTMRTLPRTQAPAPLSTGYQETLSSALSSHRTASSQDIMDRTRELQDDDTNTNSFDDLLPEIEQFGDVGQNQPADALKDLLIQHRDLTINKISSGDLLQMEVRRGNVLSDAITIIRFSEHDLHNHLCIKFIGEDGVDIGGLRREFWSLFLHNISSSCYVTGKPGRQTFQQNFVEKKKKTFFHLGQLIALSILQDGPGLPIFSDIVTDYIINGETVVLNLDDLPDGLRDTLDKMQDSASDSEARDMYSSVLDIAADVGFIVPLTSFTRCHVKQLKAAFIESQISSCKDELNQFIEGLDTHRVLSLLRQTENMASARCLFSGRAKPLTVSQLRGLLRFSFKDGNAKVAEEATAQGFLTFLQATKGTATIINGINLQPKDVLMWLTGSTIVPAIGFHKPIDVYFSPKKTFVNTCALALTLKTQPGLSPADAVSYYTELIINSQTFTKG